MQNQVLKKTLGGRFDNVFTEVNHSESLGLSNPSELRLFCLKVVNNLFAFADLQDFLLDNIGRYVYSRARMEQFVLDGNAETIALRAIRLLQKNGQLDQKGTGTELGEILVYAFLEQALGAPKIMSKIELLNVQGVYTSKSDAVHLLSVGNENTPYYQLVFGTSSIIGDIRDAIDVAFETVAKIKQSETEEHQLLETTVLNKAFDEQTTERMKQLLIPSKSQIPVDNAFGIFLGYSLGLNPYNYSNIEFRQEMQKKMALDICQHARYIREKIQSLGLSTHSFYIYVLPLNEASDDKKAIINELFGGGVS